MKLLKKSIWQSVKGKELESICLAHGGVKDLFLRAAAVLVVAAAPVVAPGVPPGPLPDHTAEGAGVWGGEGEDITIPLAVAQAILQVPPTLGPEDVTVIVHTDPEVAVHITGEIIIAVEAGAFHPYAMGGTLQYTGTRISLLTGLAADGVLGVDRVGVEAVVGAVATQEAAAHITEEDHTQDLDQGLTQDPGIHEEGTHAHVLTGGHIHVTQGHVHMILGDLVHEAIVETNPTDAVHQEVIPKPLITDSIDNKSLLQTATCILVYECRGQ